MWYHRECFFEVRLPPTEAAFDGFAQLRYAHQMAMKEDLGLLISQFEWDLVDCDYYIIANICVFLPSKGIYDTESASAVTANGLMDLENRLRIQNEEYFKIFDYILKNVPQVHRNKLLATNGQTVPASSTQVSENITQNSRFNRW